MEDVKENEMQILQGISYLRGLLNGNSGLVALDTIMAGVMKSRFNAVNLDDTMETGVYGINKDGITNSPPIDFGILLVFVAGGGSAGGGNPIVQIAINETGSALKIRVRWLGAWRSWKSITIT